MIMKMLKNATCLLLLLLLSGCNTDVNPETDEDIVKRLISDWHDFYVDKQYEDALEIVDEGLTLERGRQKGFYVLKAMTLEKLKKYDEAIQSADQGLEILATTKEAKGPLIRIAFWVKSNSFFAQDKYDEANVNITKALEEDPEILVNWEDKALIQRMRGQYDEALIAVNMALDTDESSSFAWLQKAHALRSLDEYDDAIIAINKSIEIQGELPWSWMQKAWIYAEIGSIVEAEEAIDKAISVCKSSKSKNHFICVKGAGYAEFGEYEKAVEFYDQTQGFFSKHPIAFFLKGIALEKQGRTDDALEIFEDIVGIDIDDKSFVALNGLAYALNAIGSHKEALETFDKSLVLNSYCFETKQEKAWVLSTCVEKKYRDGAAALKLLQKISKWDQKRSYRYFAAAYAELGEYDTAAEYQAKYIERLRKSGKEKVIKLDKLEETLSRYENM